MGARAGSLIFHDGIKGDALGSGVLDRPFLERLAECASESRHKTAPTVQKNALDALVRHCPRGVGCAMLG